MRVSINWLKEFVSCGALTPVQLAQRLTMGGLEVEAVHRDDVDTVLEIAVTPNRGDALSMVGVARDLAVLCKKRIKPPVVKIPRGTGNIADTLQVSVADRVRCPRYAARRIEGVTVGPSPAAIQRRLEAVGIRPINNIVDATNYVMWELGQPLHAFDARMIQGARLEVRTATAGEHTFATLDGAARRLLATDLLICDAHGPVALAGIMGGANSEVRADTTTVVLESASFDPHTVRATSKRLGLSTESSRRFERGVDPNGVVTALHRVVALICAWAGGVPTSDWVDHCPHKRKPQRIALPQAELTRLLGIQIRRGRVVEILKGLGCAVQGSGTPYRVVVPTFRPDLLLPVDLVEEIARVYGYDRIAPALPPIPPRQLHVPPGWEVRRRCLEQLQNIGFSEAIHYAFESPTQSQAFQWPGVSPLTIANPLGQDQAVLKTTLAGGLVEALARNLRNGQPNLRLCELRPVIVARDDGSMGHTLRLAGIIFGSRYPQGWTSPRDVLDFFDIKGIVEVLLEGVNMAAVHWEREALPQFLHPGRSAWAVWGGQRIGYAGELHPRLAQQFEFATPPALFECEVAQLVAADAAHATAYRPVVRHPSIRRDISMFVDAAVSVQELTDTIRASHETRMTEVALFDVYTGEKLPPGKKSIAYAIHYQHPQRTLTDEEVNTAHARVLQRLVDTCGVEIRTQTPTRGGAV